MKILTRGELFWLKEYDGALESQNIIAVRDKKKIQAGVGRPLKLSY